MYSEYSTNNSNSNRKSCCCVLSSSMDYWDYSESDSLSATSSPSKIETIHDAFDVLGLDLAPVRNDDSKPTTATATTQTTTTTHFEEDPRDDHHDHHHRTCLHLYEQQVFHPPACYNNFQYYNYNYNYNCTINHDDEDDENEWSRRKKDANETFQLLWKEFSKTIKYAYRKRILEYHPDKVVYDNDDEEERKRLFATIVEAYDILADPWSRKDWINNNNNNKSCSTVDGFMCRWWCDFDLMLLVIIICSMALIVSYYHYCSYCYYDGTARVESFAAGDQQAVATSNSMNDNAKQTLGGQKQQRKRGQYTTKVDYCIKAASYIINVWSELIQIALFDTVTTPSSGRGTGGDIIGVSTRRKNSDSQQRLQQEQQPDGTDFHRERSSSNGNHDWVVVPSPLPSPSSLTIKPKIS